MMKQWKIHFITGLLMASFLAIGLGCGGEEQTPLPPPPPPPPPVNNPGYGGGYGGGFVGNCGVAGAFPIIRDGSPFTANLISYYGGTSADSISLNVSYVDTVTQNVAAGGAFTIDLGKLPVYSQGGFGYNSTQLRQSFCASSTTQSGQPVGGTAIEHGEWVILQNLVLYGVIQVPITSPFSPYPGSNFNSGLQFTTEQVQVVIGNCGQPTAGNIFTRRLQGCVTIQIGNNGYLQYFAQ